MTTENHWLQFEDGGPKNPYWIYKDLEKPMQYVCGRLARGGGPLGWNKKSINAAHIKMSDINELITREIVTKRNLFDIAHSLVNNPQELNLWNEFNKQGGYLALNSKDKIWYYSFDLALEIVKGGPANNTEIRYQIANNGLYNYLRMFF